MAVIIHSTAIVHPQAQLGEDVEIGPGAIINAEAQIGDRTQVGAYALVDKWTTVGCDNKIFTGAIVGSECQDLKYRGEKSFAKIGDRNTIREYVTINRATDGELSTVIGNDNLIMTYAHVAHDCKIGNNNIMANAIAMAGHVTIMDHANIGGLNAIHQYVRIGSYAIIGGHSRVAKDVPPYIMCADSPLRIAGINKIGLERKGFTKDQIGIIEKAYRILYRSKLNTSQALVKLEAEARQHQEIELLVNFIKDFVTPLKRDTKKRNPRHSHYFRRHCPHIFNKALRQVIITKPELSIEDINLRGIFPLTIGRIGLPENNAGENTE